MNHAMAAWWSPLPIRERQSPPLSPRARATRRRRSCDVAAEVEDDRGLGAELGDRGEGGPGRRRAVADDAQVRARRDGQELGQALDEAEDDRFPQIPSPIPPPSSLSAGRTAAAPHPGDAPQVRALRAPGRYCRAWNSATWAARACGVSRSGLGTMTWSRDTDEHDAAEQLRDFVDAGRTLVDTSASYAEGRARRSSARSSPGQVDRARRPRCAPRRASAHGRRRHRRRLARRTPRSLDASLSAWHRPRRPLPGPTPDPRTPFDETLSALRLAVTTGRARYVGLPTIRDGRWRAPRVARRHGASDSPP